jgi:hypothetical protein
MIRHQDQHQKHLIEQIQDVENLADDTTPKQQVEVTINPDVAKQAVADEQMDTDQTGKAI